MRSGQTAGTQAGAESHTVGYRSLARYERHLSEEWAKAEDGQYWEFTDIVL
ncbi:MAG: hypothetical protein ABEH56_03690 [Salinirussus sp.]